MKRTGARHVGAAVPRRQARDREIGSDCMIRLFFVTDIHGSNVCYRKFLNALPI